MDTQTIKAELDAVQWRALDWLAAGNEAFDRGNPNRARDCYAKAHKCMDRADELQDRLNAH